MLTLVKLNSFAKGVAGEQECSMGYVCHLLKHLRLCQL